MSLRDDLMAKVARCNPIGVQHATISPGRATGHATSVQQNAAIPHETLLHGATCVATGAQQGAKSYATFGAKKGAESCTQLRGPGALTAQRIAAQLIAAAMLRCDECNDGEAARQEMREQCLALPTRLQIDLLAHFRNAHGKRSTS